MDNPGRSLYFGGSIHVDGIRAPDQEEEEEDEEENRKREAEIQGMLANAFDDLEDDESFAQQSSYNSFAFGKESRDSAYYDDGQGGKQQVNISLSSYNNVRDRNDNNVFNKFESNAQGVTDFMERERYSESFDGQEQLPESVLNKDGISRADSSGSVTPWSDDSQDDSSARFNPLTYHETVHDAYHITGQEEHSEIDADHSNYRPDNHQLYSDAALAMAQAANYQADKYKSLVERSTHEEVTDEQYRSAETSQDQMKLLYEARGRELDRLSSELSKLKFESSRDVRVLQHQVNLLMSDNESKTANINQLQTLLTEKEERIKSLISDMKELQNKVNSKENENKRIYFELETAQSTISSLECQISEMKAADTLSRNQKLHEEFVQKLKQGNNEEREVLLSKLQDSQGQAEQHQQEVTRLREELRNLRATYDDTLVQKTETATKLTVTNETLRKQYEDLMKSHDGQQIIELQIKVRSLESVKERLENQVRSLDSELHKAKEEIDGYDTAMKLGILSEVLPGEDSMVQLGIKRALNYDDTITEGQKNNEKYPEVHEKNKLKEELKRSLMGNKSKRDEITRLHEEIGGKQQRMKILESDLKSAQTEIKELRSNILKMELTQVESQKSNSQETDDGGQIASVCAENIGLREELVLLHGSLKVLEDSFKAVKGVIANWQDGLPNLSQEMYDTYLKRFDKLLGIVDSCYTSIKETKKYHEVISSIQTENNSMHKSRILWEKQLNNVQLKMKVFEKMITSVKTDSANGSEYGHAVSVLQELLEDFIQHADSLKNEMNSFQMNEVRLRDQLTKSKLQVVKLQKEVADLNNDKGNFEKQMNTLTSKKDMEKREALEECQDTYLRFHEDAIKELEAKMKGEYENISDVLKNEVSKLAGELNDARNMYINICEEKNDLESQLKKKMGEKGKTLATPVVQSNSYSVSAHDSGVDINSCKKNVYSQEDQLFYSKKIQDLQGEIASLKEASNEENKRLDLLKETLQIQFDQRLKAETEAAHADASKSLESLQKKCSTLEECNQILKDTCTSLDEKLQKSKELNNNADVGSKEIENCRYLLEKQRKYFEKQEEDMRSRYEKEISDFKNLLANTKSMNLQDSETLSMYKKTLQEQEQEIKAVVEECARVKEKLERKEMESENEVQRLTDLILNLESEVKELEEEKKYTRANFQHLIEDLQKDCDHMKQRVKTSEDKISELKDLEAKYKSMKQKFSKFQATCKEQITYYKGEISRLSTDYSRAKETLLERIRDFIEELKKKCIVCIDKTILSLQKGDSSKNGVSGAISELQIFSKEIREFSLKLT